MEDDADLRALLAECLVLHDFQVTAVGSALELYRVLAGTTVDAVVLDLNLPDLDGFTVASFLRQQTNIGIIAITADASPENRMRLFETGADLFFAKPLNSRELAAAAHGLIHRLRGTAAPPVPAPVPAPAPADAAHWTVDSARWHVSAPGGGGVRLASKEMRLVVELARSAGTPVARDRLRRVLGYADTDHGERSLEALIRRVRGKLKRTGADSAPIQTVHGAGYLFSAAVRVQ